MKIAFLGWGSLLRNNKALKIAGEWQSDGPSLPLEFSYVSRSKLLTLAILPGSRAVQTFWALSDFQDVEVAREALKTLVKTELQNIGFISRTNENGNYRIAPEKIVQDLRTWVEQKELDAVVWIDFGSNFKETTEMDFNEDNVIDFITDLSKNDQLVAEKYVISNPEQIETIIRRRLRTEFGWRNLSEYRNGFWLDKNTFIIADSVDIKMVKRKAEGAPIDQLEKIPMLIMTNAAQIIVDKNNKLLGEDIKPKFGLWLDNVKHIYKEQKLWHKEE
jgi:hypothetical protein